MRKLLNKSFIVILLLVLYSCNGTFVSKKVLESENFTFEHAGKEQKLLIELKEIKTTTRSNGFSFRQRRSGGMTKNTTFDYAIYASVTDGKMMHEIFELPCTKDTDVDDFISELKVKRSKKRDHFMISNKEKLVGIFHTFKGITFLAAYPLEKDFPYNNGKEVNLEKIEKARYDLKNHITGDKHLLISDDDLASILVKLSPKDELNYELSYAISRPKILEKEANQLKVIKHCKKDKDWLASALSSLKNKKNELDKSSYISKLYLLGGLQELSKEDEYQLDMFRNSTDLSYFYARFDNSKIILNEEIKVKIKEILLKKISNPCSLSRSEINALTEYFDFLEKMKVKNSFNIFFTSYKDSKCKGKTLHDFNNEFLFGQEKLGASDKRKWVNFVVENFDLLSSFDKRWDFSTLEKHLTCDQKRKLLTNYKKDIDTFGDKEIPNCN